MEEALQHVPSLSTVSISVASVLLALITHNGFTGNTSSGITLAGKAQGDVAITNNEFSGGTGVFALSSSNLLIGSNSIDGTGTTTGTDAIGIGGGDSGVSVLGNTVKNFTGPAIDIGDFLGVGPNSNVTAHVNSLGASNTGGAVVVHSGGYTANTKVDATGNWFGCTGGPGAPGCTVTTNSVRYIPFSLADITTSTDSDATFTSNATAMAQLTGSGTGISASATGGTGMVTAATCAGDPVAPPPFVPVRPYFDVSLSAGNTFSSATINDSIGAAAGDSLYWYNVDAGAWQLVSSASYSGVETATLNGTTSPSLADLSGTVFAWPLRRPRRSSARRPRPSPPSARPAGPQPEASADTSATALVGANRFDTAVAVADKFFTAPTTVGLATGLDFPDALAADPLLGTEGSPMLLVDPTATGGFERSLRPAGGTRQDHAGP